MTRSEQHRPEIVVGLVATPPDHPARVAARLTDELAGRLAERVDADVRWTVRGGWGEVAPRRDGGAEALLDDLAPATSGPRDRAGSRGPAPHRRLWPAGVLGSAGTGREGRPRHRP
jgi:hypothetical protein